MGTLKPGAKYIYERNGGTIYAREFGKSDRTVVGYDPVASSNGATAMPPSIVYSEWNKIFRAAESNLALQEAIDRVKIIYNLSQINE
jgi:hypothetical protein